MTDDPTRNGARDSTRFTTKEEIQVANTHKRVPMSFHKPPLHAHQSGPRGKDPQPSDREGMGAAGPPRPAAGTEGVTLVCSPLWPRNPLVGMDPKPVSAGHQEACGGRSQKRVHAGRTRHRAPQRGPLQGSTGPDTRLSRHVQLQDTRATQSHVRRAKTAN